MELGQNPQITLPQTSHFPQYSLSSQSIKEEGSFWSIFSGRHLSITETPSTTNKATSLDLKINIRYKIYPWGIHTIREGFWTKPEDSAYMPITIQQADSTEKQVYIKIKSAAKKLFSPSLQEVRAQRANFPKYLQDRIPIVKMSIEQIQQNQPDTTAKNTHDTIAKIFAKGFKLKEGQIKTKNNYDIFSENGDVIIRYNISDLERGGYGEVRKALDVANGSFTAIKKSLKEPEAPLSKNSVTERVMDHQKESDKTSCLVKVLNIRKKNTCFEEEYELASGDALTQLKSYTAPDIQQMYRSVILALEEFREIGFLHLDIKLQNILNIGSIQQPQFKLGDYDENSPAIKTEKEFKAWALKNQPRVTACCNLKSDIQILNRLQVLANAITKNNAKLSLKTTSKLLNSQPTFTNKKSILEINALIEAGQFNDAFSLVFAAYKNAAEKTAIFELGYMLYTAITHKPAYYNQVDPDDFLEPTEPAISSIRTHLHTALPKGSSTFRKLIQKMLDLNPDNRPSLDELLKD